MAFFAGGFNTGRAEVPAFEFDVAKGAQKSSTDPARNHSALVAVIKTGRLACLKKRLDRKSVV